jgi:hypothetical protein
MRQDFEVGERLGLTPNTAQVSENLPLRSRVGVSEWKITMKKPQRWEILVILTQQAPYLKTGR